ncbi:MAG: hypothetical protein AB8B74_00030 [Crocinitomicaceae bacterium]
MNKVINLFSLLLFSIFAFLAIGSIYDLGFSVYEVNDIPYIKPIAYGLSFLILLLGLIRVKRRFEGRKDIKKYRGFTFSAPISKVAINNSTVFLGIEIVFGVGLIIILVKIIGLDVQNLILPLLIIVTGLVVENIIYLVYFRLNHSIFKIGIGPQFIAYFDREMHLYYYKGMQRIEIYQNMINFKFKKDLNLFLNLDIIPHNQQQAFFESLEKVLLDKNVFFDDSYHQYTANLVN